MGRGRRRIQECIDLQDPCRFGRKYCQRFAANLMIAAYIIAVPRAHFYQMGCPSRAITQRIVSPSILHRCKTHLPPPKLYPVQRNASRSRARRTRLLNPFLLSRHVSYLHHVSTAETASRSRACRTMYYVPLTVIPFYFHDLPSSIVSALSRHPTPEDKCFPPATLDIEASARSSLP